MSKIRGLVVGTVVWLVMALWSIHHFGKNGPPDPGAWSIYFSFALFVSTGLSIGWVIDLNRELKKMTEGWSDLKRFITEFLYGGSDVVNSYLIIDAVNRRLEKVASKCEVASQRIITIQREGLNAIGGKLEVTVSDEEIEKEHARVSDNLKREFKTQQNWFYELYDLAYRSGHCRAFRKRNFKEFLKPVQEQAS